MTTIRYTGGGEKLSATRRARRWLRTVDRSTSLREMSWHFFARIVGFTFSMLIVLVVSYVAQENAARDIPEAVCVASWDCETGQRIAPDPDGPQPATAHTLEKR